MVSAYRWLMTEVAKPMVKDVFDLGDPEPSQVVVEVAGCGVCHTDLDYYYNGVRTNHPLPLALGHEISGRVVAVGAGAEPWLGRAVIIPAVIPCGECDLCRRGKGTICRAQMMPGYDIQGGFASHITVPARGLCAVDETRLAAAGLSLADLSVVADAVTTPYQAVQQSGLGEGDLAIIIGAGGVGGYCAQMARAFGATVVAIDIDPAKLAALAGVAALTLDAKAMDARALKKAIGAFAKDNGLRSTEWFIFECSGSTPGQESAFNLLVHGATLCVVGYTIHKAQFRLSNLMAYHARALGNWGCVPEHYPAALDLVLSGKVRIKPFVEPHPLDDINAIFEKVYRHELKRRAILVPAP